MKPIKRVDSARPLAPLKDVKLKELPAHAVIDPTLTPEQLKAFKAQMSRSRIQQSLDKTMQGLHSSYVNDLEKGERPTEEEIAASEKQFHETLTQHQLTQAKLRDELFAKHGMEKDLYTLPEDDGNHIIIRDTSTKDPDLQHTVVPTQRPWERSPRINVPKK